MSHPSLRLLTMFDPWGTLRHLVHVTVRWVRMPDNVPGRTNGTDIIWLDNRLQQVERRCVLAHELVHLEWRHTGCQLPKYEKAVRVETARRLIPIEQLCRHAAWARSHSELADELWVTEMVLSDRLANLTAPETAALAATEIQTH
jgi:hypothetical protein